MMFCDDVLIKASIIASASAMQGDKTLVCAADALWNSWPLWFEKIHPSPALFVSARQAASVLQKTVRSEIGVWFLGGGFVGGWI